MKGNTVIPCRICGQPKQYMAHATFHPVNRHRKDTHAFRGRWLGRNARTMWILGTVVFIILASLVVIP